MKNRFAGFTSVFKFAYIQSVKTKAFVISMVVLCAIALASLPVVSAFSSGDDSEVDEEKTELIGKIYVEDNAMEGKMAEALVDVLKENEDYVSKEFSIIDKEKHDDTFKAVKDSKEGDILVQIEYDSDLDSINYGFDYIVYYGENKEDLDEASDMLAYYIDSIHKEILADVLLNDKDGTELVTYEYTTEVINVDEHGEEVPDESALDMSEYWVTYAFLMVGIFSISIVGSKVAEQIVTEKSSKVIEYIMTSIRPMALITGKVIASIAVVFTMVGAILLAFVGSVLLNGILFRAEDGSMMIPEVIKLILDGSLMEGANLLTVIVAIVLFALGYVFYGFIAGIAGATVSKVEEMAEGIKLFTFAMVAGAYVCIAYIMSANMGAGDWGVATNVIYLLPLTSIFILPAYLLIGKASLFIGILAIVIMIICIIFLMIFVSGIYEYLIYYNGSPLKFKDLIKIFKNKRRAE